MPDVIFSLSALTFKYIIINESAYVDYILTKIIGVLKNWNLFTFIMNYIVLKNVGLDHVKREATLGI